MEVSTILDITRIKLADPLIDDSDEVCLFKTDELIYYINNALREAVFRGKLLSKSDYSITLLAGISEYDVPEGAIVVNQILNEEKERVIKINEVDLNDKSDAWRTDTEELPINFIQNTNKLIFYPIPSKDSIVTIRATYIPEDVDETDEIPPELSEIYQRDLIHWVLYEAFDKRDADTYDPGSAQENKMRFEEVFGKKPAGDQFQEIMSYPDDPGSMRD